jgi:hypothetical protein
MQTGDDFTIFALEPDDEFEHATVRIVWEDADSGQTQTLATWDGPRA